MWDRAEGIKAIIWLQGLAGIEETESQAGEGWDAMSEQDKETTMRTYHALSAT